MFSGFRPRIWCTCPTIWIGRPKCTLRSLFFVLLSFGLVLVSTVFVSVHSCFVLLSIRVLLLCFRYVVQLINGVTSTQTERVYDVLWHWLWTRLDFCTGSSLDSKSCMALRASTSNVAISQTLFFFQGCTMGLEGSVPFIMNPLKIVCWVCFASFVCFKFVRSVVPITIVTRAASFAAGISSKMHPSRVEICVFVWIGLKISIVVLTCK